MTLDNSCNSSLGPFSPSISELQPFPSVLCFANKFLVIFFLFILRRGHMTAERRVTWLSEWSPYNATYNLSPFGIRMHMLIVIIMHVFSFVAVPLSCKHHLLNIAKLNPKQSDRLSSATFQCSWSNHISYESIYSGSTICKIRTKTSQNNLHSLQKLIMIRNSARLKWNYKC